MVGLFEMCVYFLFYLTYDWTGGLKVEKHTFYERQRTPVDIL